MLFTDLPTEVHSEMASHLELPDLLNLAATNQHFQQVVNPKLLRAKMQAYEKENPHTIMTLGKRPCYGCLRMRNDDDFYTTTGFDPPFDFYMMWHGVVVHFPADDSYLGRRCYACDEQARFRHGRNLSPGMINVLIWQAPFVPAAGNGSSAANPPATAGPGADGGTE